MTYPKISVVTISYNQGIYLEGCIQSVLGQNYPNLEYIVIDGGSSDNSVDIIKKYEKKLTYWCSEPDKGPANALNKGFLKASGEILYYLNSDDLILPNTFKKMVEFIELNPKYDVYYGHGFITNENLFPKKRFYSDPWNLKNIDISQISICQQSTFIKKSAYERINGFNEKNTTCWDFELLLDLSMCGCIFKRVHIFCSIFRIYSTSISGSQKHYYKYLSDKSTMFKKYKFPQKKHYKFFYFLNKVTSDPFVFLLKIFDISQKILSIDIYKKKFKF